MPAAAAGMQAWRCRSVRSLAAHKRKVLIIHFYTSEYPRVRKLHEGIYEEVNRLPLEQRPEIYEEQLDAARLGKAAISEQ